MIFVHPPEMEPAVKEMLGGCCVCADDNENPLVYCDGPDCEVAVHQGCYGIVDVPEGEWLCAKCSVSSIMSKSGNGSILPNGKTNGIIPQPFHPRCELCPFGYGALKRTDKNPSLTWDPSNPYRNAGPNSAGIFKYNIALAAGWAHVICALYIPEVRFGDVHCMDPVILSDVPKERYERMCYLCEEEGALKAAKMGACMNCNKSGCKKSFHVTCAQRKGLLCEEVGGSNVKYCGYCAHHLKKACLDAAIKVVPPCKVRPLPPPGSAARAAITQAAVPASAIRSALVTNGKLLPGGGPSTSSYPGPSSSSSSSSNGPSSSREGSHKHSHKERKERDHKEHHREHKEHREKDHHRDHKEHRDKHSSGSSKNREHKTKSKEDIDRMMIDQSKMSVREAFKAGILRTEEHEEERQEPTPASTVSYLGMGSDGLQPPPGTGSTTFSPPLTSSSRSSLTQENVGNSPPQKENGHSSERPGPSNRDSLTPPDGPHQSFGTAPTPPHAAVPLDSPPLEHNGDGHLFNGVGGPSSDGHPTNHNRIEERVSPALSTESGSSCPGPSNAPEKLKQNGTATPKGPSPQPTTADPLITAMLAPAPGKKGELPLPQPWAASNPGTLNHTLQNVHPSVSGDLPVSAVIAAGLVQSKPTPSNHKRRNDGEATKGTKRPRAYAPKGSSHHGASSSSSAYHAPDSPSNMSVDALMESVHPIVADLVTDFQREREVDREAAAAADRNRQAAQAAAASLHQQLLCDVRTERDATPSMGGHLTSAPSTSMGGDLMALGSCASSFSNGGFGGLAAFGLSGSQNQPPSTATAMGVPSTMEELLERQWEQGTNFILTNSTFDVAQLLGCLHSLRKENARLAGQAETLMKRREHLNALTSRLSQPLGATAAQAVQLNNHRPNAMAAAIAAAAPQQSIQQGPASGSPFGGALLSPPPVASPLGFQMPGTAEDSLSALRALTAGALSNAGKETPSGSMDSSSFAPSAAPTAANPATSMANLLRNPVSTSASSSLPSSFGMGGLTSTPPTSSPSTMPSSASIASLISALSNNGGPADMQRLASMLTEAVANPMNPINTILSNPTARNAILGPNGLDQLIATMVMQGTPSSSSQPPRSQAAPSSRSSTPSTSASSLLSDPNLLRMVMGAGSNGPTPPNGKGSTQ